MKSRSQSPVPKNSENKHVHHESEVKHCLQNTNKNNSIANISMEQEQTNALPFAPASNKVSTSKHYGPTLPSNLSPVPKEVSCSLSFSKSDKQLNCASSPELPAVYGPVLPPSCSSKSDIQTDRVSIYGPQLPAGSSKSSDLILEKKPKLYGPLLPATKTNIKESFQDADGEKDQTFCGNLKQSKAPQLQSYSKIASTNVCKNVCTSGSSDDDECYGPLPINSTFQSKAHIALEERALQIKLDSLEKDGKDGVVREEWMIELPEVHSRNLGLGPRQFRANPRPDFSDRSSWTDTPQKKAKKVEEIGSKFVDLKHEARMKEQQKYDEQQEKIIKKHKRSKKEKSLVEIHEKKMKQQKKEEGTARRPFNRDTDLKVNYFDEAQRKAILKKAQLLDDRFSKGESKFL